MADEYSSRYTHDSITSSALTGGYSDTSADRSTDHDADGTPRRSRRKQSTAGEFSGASVPLQLRLPTDLIQSLKLLAFDEGSTVSEVALRMLTTTEACPRVWLSRRNAG